MTRWQRLIRRLRRPARRRGIALILALAMLAMMVMLAMSFAASAIWTRTAARVNESITHSRQLAETGLQRAISAMKVELKDTNDYTTYYPGTRNFVAGTGDWTGFYYFTSVRDVDEAMDDGLLESLSYSRSGIDYLPRRLPQGLPGDVAVSWIPVFGDRVIRGVTRNVIVGRYAFLIWDESGKIDPNPTTSTTHAEGGEPVLGYTLDEISLVDAGIGSSFANRLRPYPAGRAPQGAKWFSLYHMATLIGADQSTVDQMNQVFFPYRRPDTLESTMAAYDIANAANDSVANLVANIPWLTNWPERGDFDVEADRAKNIAANLIDYCDTDRDATTDSTSDPSYWGVEQCPYLSRVQVKVSNASYPSGTRTYPRLQFDVRGEVVNMHGDLSGYTHQFRLYVQLLVRWTDDSGQGHQDTVDGTETFTTGSSATGNFNASGYVRSTSDLTLYATGSRINDRYRYPIRAIQVELVAARVGSAGGDDWSFGRAEACTGFALDAVGDYEYVTFAARNPVNCLWGEGWTSTVGIANRFLSPYTAVDADCPDLWLNYPMFVRNAPMQHLVEVGCLYRMEPWDSADPDRTFRTLNLVDYKYNGDQETPGMYSEAADGIIDNLDDNLEDGEGNGGDRNILDQVRLGTTDAAEKVLVGRLNINSPRRDVMNSLFRRVDTCQFTDGSAIPADAVDVLITNVIEHTATSPLPMGIFSRYRNPPLYGLLFQEGFITLPEIQTEYLVLMTQQLVTAEHNYFSAIVAGEAILDVGDVTLDGVDCEYGVYEEGRDQVLAEQRIRAIIYRNAFTNRFVLERFEYLED